MKTFIIFEAGVNHNGDFRLAHRMIDEAVRNGADAIKFQKWGKEYYDKCEWRNVLDGLELSNDEFMDLKKYAKIKGIDFFITAFDNESFDFVKELDIDIYKIPSNQCVVDDRRLINKIISTSLEENKRLFISTSRFSFRDIRHLWKRNRNAVFFHCVSKYPTPVKESNLDRLYELDRRHYYYGLSDHSATIEVPIAAVALGAMAIEVHVTLDKNMNGPDHKASLDINEFSTMVKMIRNVEKAL